MNTSDIAWSTNASLFFSVAASYSEPFNMVHKYMSARWITDLGADYHKNRTIMKQYHIIKEPIRLWIKDIVKNASTWDALSPWWKYMKNQGMHRAVLEVYPFIIQHQPAEYEEYLERHGITAILQEAIRCDILSFLNLSAPFLKERDIRMCKVHNWKYPSRHNIH